MQKLIDLYRQWKGAEPANVHQLAGAGSNRSYFRLTDQDGQTVIGVIGTSRDENHAFIYLTEHFSRRKLPVPEVLAASDDELRYLQTDLGSVSLFDAVRGGREAGGRYTLKEQELLRKTIRELSKNCCARPFASCRTSRYVVPADSTSPTAIPRRSLMWIVCCST